MPDIFKRATRVLVCSVLFCAPAQLFQVVASPAHARGEASRTQIILNLIAVIKNSDDRSTRFGKSHELAVTIYRAKRSGHSLDKSVIRGLGDLMEVPEARFWTALAIGQLGSRASSLAPKLMAAFDDESRRKQERLKREGILIDQGEDPQEGICVALKRIGAEAPKSCSEG